MHSASLDPEAGSPRVDWLRSGGRIGSRNDETAGFEDEGIAHAALGNPLAVKTGRGYERERSLRLNLLYLGSFTSRSGAMSEQKNIELIKSGCAAFTQGDLQTLLDFFSEDLDLQHPMPRSIWPWAGKRNGRARLAEIRRGIIRNRRV
jgi:hypothetical protein